MWNFEEKIQDLIRRQKFIKTFLNLFKELLQENQKLQPIDFEMANYIFQILAKLTFKNSNFPFLQWNKICWFLEKNQDYFVKKNGHEFIKSILASSKDLNLTQAGIYILANCCDKSTEKLHIYFKKIYFLDDTRLLLWCGGFLAFTLKKLVEKSEALFAYYKNNPNIQERKTEIINVYKEIEVFQLLIWKMSLDTGHFLCFSENYLKKL